MEVLQRTANRGSISTATSYDIDNSIKFESANTESLTKSQTASNRRTWTLSWWFKRTKVDTDLQYMFHANVSSGNEFYLVINGTSDFRIDDYASGAQIRFHSGGSGESFRDSAAWYHIVIACDTTQSTEANRFKVYLNGVDVTAISGFFSTAQYPSQNYDTHINDSSSTLSIGKSISASTNFCGYMCEFNFIDGLMKEASDFGEFDSASGIWKPKEYTGSYGNEGYYLDFADAADLGDDESGNGNDFTENNIAAADQATDTPTNNFAIGNVLTSKERFLVTTEGATKGVLSTSGPGNNTGGVSLISTIPVSRGKWYFEAQNTNSGDVYLYLGVGDTGSINLWGIDGVKLSNQTSSSVAWRGGGSNDGKVYGRSAGTNYTSTNPVTWETEVVGLALDLDNGVIYFHKSGTYINSGDPAGGTDNGGQYDLVTGVDNQWCIAVSAYNLATWHINFGGYTTMSISSAESDENGYGTFEYAPPSGYYALCTKNLAEYG